MKKLFLIKLPREAILVTPLAELFDEVALILSALVHVLFYNMRK